MNFIPDYLYLFILTVRKPISWNHTELLEMHFWALSSPFLFSLQLNSFSHLFFLFGVLEVIHPKLIVELTKLEIQTEENNKSIKHYFKPSLYDLVSTPFTLVHPRTGTWVGEGKHQGCTIFFWRLQNLRKHSLLGSCQSQLCTWMILRVNASLRKRHLGHLPGPESERFLKFCALVTSLASS